MSFSSLKGYDMHVSNQQQEQRFADGSRYHDLEDSDQYGQQSWQQSSKPTKDAVVDEEDEEEDSIDIDEDNDVSSLDRYYPLLNEVEYNDPFFDEFGRPITLTPPPIAMPPPDASYSEEFINMVRRCVNKAQCSIQPASSSNTTATSHNKNQQKKDYTHSNELLDEFIDSLNQGLTVVNTIKNGSHYTSTDNCGTVQRNDKGKQKMTPKEEKRYQGDNSLHFESLIDYNICDTPEGVLSHRIRLATSPVAPRLSTQASSSTNTVKKTTHGHTPSFQDCQQQEDYLFPTEYHKHLPKEDMSTVEQGRREGPQLLPPFSTARGDRFHEHVDILQQQQQQVSARDNEYFILDRMPNTIQDLHYVSNEQFRVEKQVRTKEKELMDTIDNEFNYAQESERRFNQLAKAQQQAQQKFAEEYPKAAAAAMDEELSSMNESKDFSSWLCFDNDDEYAKFKNFIEKNYGDESNNPRPTSQEQRVLHTEKNLPREAEPPFSRPTLDDRNLNASPITPLLPALVRPTAALTEQTRNNRTPEAEETKPKYAVDVQQQNDEQQYDLSTGSFQEKIVRTSTPKKKAGTTLFSFSGSYSKKTKNTDVSHQPQQKSQQRLFKSLFEDDDNDGSINDSIIVNEKENASRSMLPTTSRATSKRFLSRSSTTIGRDQTTRRTLFSLTK